MSNDRYPFIGALLLAGLVAGGVSAQEATMPPGTVRLKDVTSIQGEKATPLVGYGLVVGLNRTGDRRQNVFSAQTLANMLERFGVAVAPGDVRVENVATVLVTAALGPYARAGAMLDVTASSVGDARSLQGGTLMPTALRGPDGHVVALAQGPLSIGGFGASAGDNSVQVNHLTVGRVPNGGIVQETPQAAAIGETGVLRLALHDPDFVAASRIALLLNERLGRGSAQVLDAGAIAVTVPPAYRDSVPDLIALIEPLPVELDSVARVVINERTGTVVLGGDVRLAAAAVAHGNLSVRITTSYDVSQPGALAQGQTVVTPQTDVAVDEGRAQLVTLEPGTTLADVVRALNLLGATPRDIIAIMQALKAAGALRAELVIL